VSKKGIGGKMEKYLRQQPSKTDLDAKFRLSLILGGLILFLSFAGSSAALAQDNAAFVMQRRAIEAKETGISNRLVWLSSRANGFHVAERSKGRQLPITDTGIIKLTPFGQRISTARIAAAIADPINMAFDRKTNRLLILQFPDNKLIQVLEKPDGNLDPSTLIVNNAGHFGLKSPQGMTVDPASGHLFILDAVGPKLVRIERKPNGGFDKALITEVDLRPTGLVEVRGLAFEADHWPSSSLEP
jgi:hypothetical protein